MISNWKSKTAFLKSVMLVPAFQKLKDTTAEQKTNKEVKVIASVSMYAIVVSLQTNNTEIH